MDNADIQLSETGMRRFHDLTELYSRYTDTQKQWRVKIDEFLKEYCPLECNQVYFFPDKNKYYLLNNLFIQPEELERGTWACFFQRKSMQFLCQCQFREWLKSNTWSKKATNYSFSFAYHSMTLVPYKSYPKEMQTLYTKQDNKWPYTKLLQK